MNKMLTIAALYVPMDGINEAGLCVADLEAVSYTHLAAGKESAGRLNEATLDRVENALTYRVYGQDENRNADYEICLADYEKKAVSANIWENAMQPLYQIISMMLSLIHI